MAAIRITSLLGMGMLRNTFVTSVCRLTMLHAPQSMQLKNAHAFRALLVVADENGNHMHVSRLVHIPEMFSTCACNSLLYVFEGAMVVFEGRSTKHRMVCKVQFSMLLSLNMFMRQPALVWPRKYVMCGTSHNFAIRMTLSAQSTRDARWCVIRENHFACACYCMP